jgi:hypothetical protein
VICTCKRFATDPQLVGHIGGRPTLRGPLQIDRAGRVFQTHMARRVSPWESRHHAPRHVTSASAPLEAGAGSAAMTSLGSQVTVWRCLLTSANSSALVAATSDLGALAPVAAP